MEMKKFWDYGPLHVMENGRTLANGDRPFFWMGDTAWLIFQKPTIEEAKLYLHNRKEKQFNVIQATLVHTLDSDDVIWKDPKNPEYWNRIDQIMDYAEQEGLYMALLPCWGSFVQKGLLTEETALTYADFLGERFKNRPNIIWLLGGDVRGDANLALYNVFGNRLRELFPQTLIGFHPFGRTSSSLWFHDAEWLDFNMFQSGHRRYDQVHLGRWDDNLEKEGNFGEDNWRYVDRDLERTPKKPTVDGEPSYEWILQGLHGLTEPYWKAPDVRRYAYWAVLAGAMGHTYGDNSIMQFYAAPATIGAFGVKDYWQDALHHEGAGEMAHLVRLMESVDFPNGIERDDLLTDGQKEKYHRVSVFAGDHFLIAYTYLGESFRLNLSGFTAIEGSWFDPETGVFSTFGAVPSEDGVTFTPPVKYTGSADYCLVLRF